MSHSHHGTPSPLGATWLLLCLACGCADSTYNAPFSSDTSPAVTLSAPLDVPAAEKLQDGQIIGLTLAATEAEIAAARLAATRAASADVRRFAERMEKAYGDVDRGMVSVADAQGIATVESTLCKQLKRASGARSETLASVSGVEFDRHYLAAEQQSQQELLDLLDTRFLPAAKNPALKVALLAARSDVVDHMRWVAEVRSNVGA